MKHDLRDVTFTIPVRRDSKDREENLDLQIRYLKHHFECTVLIGEESSVDYFRKVSPSFADNLADEIVYFESFDQNFHRTKVLNDLAKAARTPYIVNLDCDVFFPVQSYIDAANALRSGNFDFIFPYLGMFMEIPRTYYPEIKKSMSLDCVDLAKCGVNHPNSVGGAIFQNREKFIESGMENEFFTGWGWEDVERVCRWQKLGYKIGRVGASLLHLEHQRGPTSTQHHPSYNKNLSEYSKVSVMSPVELRKYVNSWSWL